MVSFTVVILNAALAVLSDKGQCVCVCVCVCGGGGGGGGVAPPVFATELPPSTPLISVYMHPHVFFNART